MCTRGNIVETLEIVRRWYAAGILRLIINEKYVGDCLMQKTISKDFRDKRRYINEGQEKQLLVKNSHVGIVSREIWERAAAEVLRRYGLKGDSKKIISEAYKITTDGVATGKHSRDNAFSAILKCTCGGKYRRYARYYKGNKTPLWICQTHEKRRDECAALAVKEDDIKAAFVRAVNKFIDTQGDFKDTLMESIRFVLSGEQQAEYDTKRAEIDGLQTTVLNLNTAYSVKEISYEIYRNESAAAMNRIDELRGQIAEYERVEADKRLAETRLQEIEALLDSGLYLTEFEDGTFKALTDSIMIQGKTLIIKLNCGVTLIEAYRI
jgi:hypothetical protein